MAPADPLETSWLALRDHWDDPKAHEGYVALAASLGRLAEAATNYRTSAEDPALAEGADRGKKLVVVHAIAQLESVPRDAIEKARDRGKAAVPVVFLLLLFGVSVMLSVATHNRTFTSLPVLALEILVVAILPWRRMLR